MQMETTITSDVLMFKSVITWPMQELPMKNEVLWIRQGEVNSLRHVISRSDLRTKNTN
jgi:hypothetical protein